MPDITMCLNKECPRRHECYYFMAIPSPNRQSYANLMNEDGTCDSFLQIKEGMRIREVEPVNKPIRIEL